MNASPNISFFEREAQKLLAPTGIQIDGPNPWDIHLNVHGSARTRLFMRVILERSLGLAEAYIEGDWECEDLTGFFDRLLRLSPNGNPGLTELLISWQDKFINRQNVDRAKKVGEQHYDIPHELYAAMLGPTQLYTCAYFKDGITDLTKAQEAKIDLVVRKLQLAPNMTILDIGCGWGALGEMISRACPGIHYKGISISKEQIARAQAKYSGNKDLEFYFMDYRAIPSDWKFDRVVSLGMIEHVGHKNLPELFETIARVLAPDGMALTHFMHGLTPQPNDPFYEKYIFPGGELVTLDQVHAALGRKMLIQDYHEIGRNYSPTLEAWYSNFDSYWNTLSDDTRADVYGVLFPKYWQDLPLSGKTSEETRALRLKRAERFNRMWRLYLKISSAASMARKFILFQHLLVQPSVGVKLIDPVR